MSYPSASPLLRIEKMENPYDDEIGWHSEQEAFEEARQKILSLLTERGIDETKTS